MGRSSLLLNSPQHLFPVAGPMSLIGLGDYLPPIIVNRCWPQVFRATADRFCRALRHRKRLHQALPLHAPQTCCGCSLLAFTVSSNGRYISCSVYTLHLGSLCEMVRNGLNNLESPRQVQAARSRAFGFF